MGRNTWIRCCPWIYQLLLVLLILRIPPTTYARPSPSSKSSPLSQSPSPTSVHRGGKFFPVWATRTYSAPAEFFATPPPTIYNHGLIFKTEPHMRQESFDVMHMTQNRSLLAPGYIFLDAQSPHGHEGAQIYDMDGNLVWYLASSALGQDIKVCDYLGSQGSHLCMHQRSNPQRKTVWDKHYQKVQSWSTSIGLPLGGTNGHEMNMLPGGYSYLQPNAPHRSIDYPDNPTQSENEDGLTTVADGCFQEVQVESGESLMDWCGLDHLNVWDTTMYLHVQGQENRTSWKAGRGSSSEHPWDYFHINSIDKSDGDYIASARHMDQIIKIAGPNNSHGVLPGKVLWRLGGKTTDFAMNFTFSKQHDIRFVSVTSTQTTISLLDNAWEGTNEPSSYSSSVKIIQINNSTMTATLLNRYDHPQHMLAQGQGSAQLLPNANVFSGWGRLPDMSEHSQDGQLLYYARFTTVNSSRSLTPEEVGMQLDHSYRIVKFPWVGEPTTKPKLLSVFHGKDAREQCALTAYVSWNGATQVRHWRFTSAASPWGPWQSARISVDKTGFETTACLTHVPLVHSLRVPAWVKAEALDENGQLLSFVVARARGYPSSLIGILVFLFFVSFVEAVAFTCHTFGRQLDDFVVPMDQKDDTL